MKKGDKVSMIDRGILEINHLIKVLGTNIEKLGEAYSRKDHREFNLLKKEILQIQRKINSLISENGN
ncbi:MAG: hypothetical protein AABX79_00585 [Nanoarchaeota archaeon]